MLTNPSTKLQKSHLYQYKTTALEHSGVWNHCAKAFRAIRVSVIQIIIQAAQLFSVYLLMSVN